MASTLYTDVVMYTGQQLPSLPKAFQKLPSNNILVIGFNVLSCLGGKLRRLHVDKTCGGKPAGR